MLKNLRKLFGVEEARKGSHAPTPRRARTETVYGHPLVTHSIIGQTMIITVVERELNVTSASDVCYEIHGCTESGGRAPPCAGS